MTRPAHPLRRRRRPRGPAAAALAGLVVLAGAAPGAGAGQAAPAAAVARIPAALPGAPPFSAALRQALARALAARGADYVPRTRQRGPDGSPRYTNRLLLEASPYLEQHAHNPVDWHPWGDEAFELARRLDRPLLVSIGYSTCHWCHVMEEESFDDPALAEFLNAHFVAIKVDRESRPDVDSVYMSAVRAMTGQGGWPLNVWVTPDRKPFYGGTYFPPEDRGARPGFLRVLRAVDERYRGDRAGLDRLAERIAAAVRRDLAGGSALATRIPGPATLKRARADTARAFDGEWGGLGRQPKFPARLPVRFLLRYHRRTGDAQALAMATLSLEKMAAGGIHDQLGGGFHRYATDRRWLVPHFEKMLYDNALLAVAYLEAWQATGRADFADVARRILDYVAREMTSPEGAFYSATDADSPNPSGEAEEGWFFTWTPGEIEAAVGPAAAAAVVRYYGVSEAGNFEGRNILHVARPLAPVAAQLGLEPAALAEILEQARARLYAARSRRPPPLRDEKVLADWNGLMISAFARAGFALGEPGYTAAARRAAGFVLERMRADGRLRRVHKDGEAGGPAVLEDYAYLVAGLLDLYEADADPRWLREALALQAVLDRHYADATGGGYFRTADDQPVLLAREKPAEDGALPSGNSVAARNLLRLYALRGDERYREQAALLFSAFYEVLEAAPAAFGEMLLAVDHQLDAAKEIVVVARERDGALDAMLAPLRQSYVPNRVVSVVTEGDDRAAHAALVPLVEGKVARRGQVTAYVCENRVCDFPTADPAVFARQIRKVRALE